MQYIKTVVGLDISKDTFTARIGTLDNQLKQNIFKACSFNNDIKGFMKLLSWTRKTCQNLKISIDNDAHNKLQFVMEATGIYYENLAYFLSEENKFVSVILPNKIKNFGRTLETKSKTDDIDAAIITQFGLEKTLQRWELPSPNFKKLKDLSREHQNIKRLSTIVKNQIHAKKHSHSPDIETMKRMKEQLKLHNKQLKQIMIQIKQLIESDDELNSRIKRIQTIKGVGLITIISVIAETNGFALIRNIKQITSYSGMDIVQKQSGKFEGKTRISKKGNKHIRSALYMPALSACRYNENMKRFYIKLIIRKKVKKIAVIAVARKLLILIYTLWKNNSEYIPNYQNA